MYVFYSSNWANNCLNSCINLYYDGKKKSVKTVSHINLAASMQRSLVNEPKRPSILRARGSFKLATYQRMVDTVARTSLWLGQGLTGPSWSTSSLPL